MNRPRPPSDLISMDGMMMDRFVPAPELLAWIRENYLAEGGPLFDPVHSHLESAAIGVLWTNVANSRHMRRIVGEAELVKNIGGTQGAWRRARGAQQIAEWFGSMPDFLLTFDAVHAEQSEDVSFAALIFHELCHCAQELDEFGNPKFDKATGQPRYALRGHDVSEFTAVVRNFGIEAAGQDAVDFVVAAAGKPRFGVVRIADACGTCATLRIAA